MKSVHTGIEVRELPPDRMPNKAEANAAANARKAEIDRAYARGRGDAFAAFVVGACSGGTVGILVGALLL